MDVISEQNPMSAAEHGGPRASGIGITGVTAGRILPLAVPESRKESSVLLEGLTDGGIDAVEIALRHPYSEQAIVDLIEGGGLVVGAGTVRTVDQVNRMHSLGTGFIVCPGFSERVVERARELELPVIPGVATASEVMRAVDLGVTLVKVFPANLLGGAEFIKALMAVFPEVRFIPSGGVDAASILDYLAVPAVPAVSGSWITSAAQLEAGPVRVANVARDAVALAREVGR